MSNALWRLHKLQLFPIFACIPTNISLHLTRVIFGDNKKVLNAFNTNGRDIIFPWKQATNESMSRKLRISIRISYNLTSLSLILDYIRCNGSIYIINPLHYIWLWKKNVTDKIVHCKIKFWFKEKLFVREEKSLAGGKVE